MSIDFKDEYPALRQAMYERFERIHDTAKYGIIAFTAFLSYYLGSDFDPTVALLVSQMLAFSTMLTALNHYRRIYIYGTYIAFVIEKDSEARWHRMSRLYSKYLQAEGKNTWWSQWYFPIGIRWGADPAQFSILIFALLFTSIIVVCFKIECWNAVVY